MGTKFGVVIGLLLLIIILAASASTSQSNCTKPESMSNLTLNQVGTFPGGQLVSHPGHLTNLSSNYQLNMNCSWTIRIPNNSTLIHFKIVSLDLETSIVHSPECQFANLTVEYRDVLTDRLVSKVACRSLHLSYFTSKSDVVLKFVTDRTFSKSGFHLVWLFIPLRDAFRLPKMEDTRSFSCPEFVTINNTGALVLDSMQQNINCRWPLVVNVGEVMNISLIYGDGIFRFPRFNSHFPFGPCCRGIRNRLMLSFIDASGRTVSYCFCGNRTTGFKTTAFPGQVTVLYHSEMSLREKGFRIMYSRLEDHVHRNCSEPQVVSRYGSKLVDDISMTKSMECEWTVKPLDENHGVEVTVSKLDKLRHQRGCNEMGYCLPGRDYILALSIGASDCSCAIGISTNDSISLETIRNGTLMLLSNASSGQANSVMRPAHLNRCCGRKVRRYYPQHSGLSFTNKLISLGPVSIRLRFSRRAMDLQYEIKIQHFPIAKHGSKLVCSTLPVVSTKNTVLKQEDGGRMVSVRQITMQSSTDCVANQRSFHPIRNGFGIRVSVNCTLSGGYISILDEHLSVYFVNCNNSAILYPLLVALEAVGTGGFTVILEKLEILYDQSHICHRAKPEKHWEAHLILYSPTPFSNLAGMTAFYCTTTITARPGHELIVRLQMPFSNDYQEQFCSEIGSLHYQPKLSFFISSPHRDSEMKLSLCDHNLPGGLRLQDRIRIGERESLTVDSTLAYIERPGTSARSNTNATSDPVYGGFSVFRPDEEVNGLIIVDLVEVCERLPSSGEQWQVSPDGTQLLSTVAVAPDNTQTDCNLQLDAPTAAGIANQSKFVSSDASKLSNAAGCWNLEVKLDEFSTVCGLKQLVMTVSHWDSLAETVVHSQREICGSDSPVGYRIAARLQPAGSGMSLQYSGVRSGFRAQFSISACSQILQLNEQLADSPVTAVSVSPALIAALIILSLCNVLAVLFVFRARIFHCAGRLVGQQSRQLNTTGTDGLNPIIEDMSVPGEGRTTD